MQAGFSRERSCNDQVFTLKRIKEIAIEQQVDYILNLIGFEKACDSIYTSVLKNTIQYEIHDTFERTREKLFGGSTGMSFVSRRVEQ